MSPVPGARWRPSRMLALTAGSLLGAVFSLVPSDAEASGITLGRFGGIYGHPNVDGGLALYWNPARLARRPGYFLTIDSTIIRRVASYNRTVGPENEYYGQPGVQETNAGLATTSILGYLPYAAVGGAWDAGGIRFATALGVHPAYGGSSTWDKNYDAPAEYPGAVDGTQRWQAISSSFVIVHYVGAAAVMLPEYGFSFGLAASLVTGEIESLRARNVNRGEALLDERGYLQEGRVYFVGNDTKATIALGATYENDLVTVSAQYRNGYTLHLRGDLYQAFGTQDALQVNAFLDFPTPNVLQGAMTLRLGRSELTAVADWSQWSRMQANNIFVVKDPPDLLLEIPRDLKDTLSLRGIAGWNFTDDLNASVMFGWDPTAVPETTIDAAFSDANKIQLGAGVRWGVNEHLRFLGSYTWDRYATVETQVSIQEPLANGTYKDSRHWINLSLEGRF